MSSKNSNRKKWWIRIGIVAAIILVLAVLINNVSGSTQPIKDTADKFKASKNWTLSSEDVTPPRFFCFNGGSCPQLDRRWTTNNVVSFETIKSILEETGWTYKLGKECESMEETAQTYDAKYLCSIDASTSKFNATIYIEKSKNHSDGFKITLYLW